MNTPTRPATPDDARPVELPNLRAPRLPTFFADPVTGVATDLPLEPDTIPDNSPPDCSECGHPHDEDDPCPASEPDFETEDEWLNRRLGW